MEKRLDFGTDGIRGEWGRFPFVSDEIEKIGVAISEWYSDKNCGKQPSVVICSDTRISCDLIEKSLIKGLSSRVSRVFLAGVLPTPALLKVMLESKRFDIGLVVSASHNLYKDNGVKVFEFPGGKLEESDENKIIQLYEKLGETKKLGSSQKNKEFCDRKLFSACKIYEDSVLSRFKPGFLSGRRVVLDLANGATFKVAPEIFKRLGADVEVINSEPNGKNINENCGAVCPEALQKEVVCLKADIGFAFDGDGDRVMATTRSGDLRDGDDILGLLIKSSEFHQQKFVVGTITTNYGLEELLEDRGKKLLRTKVGDKFISRCLGEKDLQLGGETSGHVIMASYLNVGDGIYTALKVMQVLDEINDWDFDTFDKMPQIMVNVRVSNRKPLDLHPCKKIIDLHRSRIKSGRMVVRYSGTENLLRVMVEEKSLASAESISQDLANELKLAVNS
jgi:phosphoglucosamine mutase